MAAKAAAQDALGMPANGPATGRLARLATYASVSVALLLVSIKAMAWFTTDSVAVLSSLIDSMLDALASCVTLFAVRKAQ